jgi:hypothetical protein
MRGLDWWVVRTVLRAYGWALAIGVVFALLVGIAIYVFHISGREVAGFITSLFQ